MSLLVSVHRFDDVPVCLYPSREAALADKDNWTRADQGTEFLGFKLIDFKDGVPSPSDLIEV